MKYEDFMQALQADAELKRKFHIKLEEAEPTDAESAWKASSDAARELGFDVDPSEFALAQRSAQPLSDDELDAVSGGSQERCVMDYICRFGWNACYATSECTDYEVCGNNITCLENNWIRPRGANGKCDTNYVGHTA